MARRVVLFVAAVVFACVALGVTASLVWDHHGERGCPKGNTLEAITCRDGR